MTVAPAFLTVGAQRFAGVVWMDVVNGLRQRLEPWLEAGAGVRLRADETLQALVSREGAVGQIATSLREQVRPVRMVLFDKTANTNWAVGWHQDRTIAVAERLNVEGFGPWSVKGSIPHVEPPFALMERMLTLRLHLDDCGADNAPLRVAPGSHRLGRVASALAAEIARRDEPLVCFAAAGDVWAYATTILHASDRAARPSRRRVLQIDYSDADLPGGLAWRGVAA